LAEVFFEELYGKKCYGIITTHYSNIKLKAASLHHAINGSMLFDKESLEPLFKLDIGQPGSSFTFEVAKINGIPDALLKSAEDRLDDNKVKMDKLIAELQMEKSQIQRLTERQLKAELDAQKAENKYKLNLSKLTEEEKAQAKLIEENNNALNRGKKLNSFVKRYDIKGKNKGLLDEIKKYLAVERTKELDIVKANTLKQEAHRKKNKKAKVRPNQHLIKIGSTVRLLQGKENGQVLEMDKDSATVAFGVFKTKVKLNQLKFMR
ncbi:MAG: MutS2/Smr-associated SH3 domain-containing protein, partial [Flavobacteriales bacterium]